MSPLAPCKVAYDLIEAGVPEWWYPLAGAAAMGFVYVTYKAYVRLAPDAMQKLASPKLGLAGALIATAYAAIYAPAEAVLNYYDLKAQIAAHRVHHVEGQVREYRAFVSQTENFSVCAKRFVIRPDDDHAGFHDVRGTDSPVREGASVKVNYVGDAIVRLDICPMQSPLRCRTPGPATPR